MFWKTKKSKAKKGFTLIEVVVAVFIFAMMMAAVSGIFTKIIQSHRDARAIQENLESAQYAMNLIAKALRTSSVDGSGESNSILLYNYSQGKCIIYSFVDNKVRSQEAIPASFSDMTDCSSIDYGSIDPSIIAENVDGKFKYSDSSNKAGSEAMGKVTVSMIISQGGDTVRIQSSVSLRDYVQALPSS